MWFTELLPAAQPLREGARQRRRMDPRGDLKTNVKLSIPHACHPERGEKTLSFAVKDSRFPHMCRTPLRFPHLSFIPPVPYPPLRGTFPSRGRLRYENTLYSKTPRRFPIFMRRTTPVEPLEPIEPAPPLSTTIKGQHAPEPLSHLCYNRENHSLHERSPL